MNQANAPSKITLPFSSSGSRNVIPVPSQIGITPGAASFTDGFPPLTMTPLGAGGVPPSGLDMNGIFYTLSELARWLSCGAEFPFDSTFANDPNVQGYPKGAKVVMANGLGYWLNLLDGNITNPDTVGSQGWVPLNGIVFSFDASSPPSAPFMLGLRDRLVITFEGPTVLPFYVATSPGQAYKALVIASAVSLSGTISAGDDLNFCPNDQTYTSAFSPFTVNNSDAYTSSLPSPYVDSSPLVTNAPSSASSFYMDLFSGPCLADPLNDRGPFILEMIFSTATSGKMIKWSSGLTGGPASGFGLWNDTTTLWTSLGTLNLVGNISSASGTILIERIA